MNAKELRSAIRASIEHARKTYPGVHQADDRAGTFVAHLSGRIQVYDEALGSEIFAVLSPLAAQASE